VAAVTATVVLSARTWHDGVCCVLSAVCCLLSAVSAAVRRHHDGGFSASTPPPPAIVSMYCERAPSRGGSVLQLGSPDRPSDAGRAVSFEPGATLFYSTRLALRLAPSDLAARARRMTVVYGRRGFAKIQASAAFWQRPIATALILGPLGTGLRLKLNFAACTAQSSIISIIVDHTYLQRDLFPILDRKLIISAPKRPRM
jgi:hypothetical protein